MTKPSATGIVFLNHLWKAPFMLRFILRVTLGTNGSQLVYPERSAAKSKGERAVQ